MAAAAPTAPATPASPKPGEPAGLTNGPTTAAAPGTQGAVSPAAGPATADPPPEYLEWLAKADPELVKRTNRQIANYIGNESDKLSNAKIARLRPQLEREVADNQALQAQVAELRRLRDEDPDAFAAKDKELEEQNIALRARLQEQAQVVQSVWGEVDAQLRAFNATLPYDVQTKLANKRFVVRTADNVVDEAASRMAYFSEAFGLSIEHARTKGVEEVLPGELLKRQREIEEGLSKVQNGHAAKAQGTLDRGGEVPTAGEGPMDQTEFESILGNKALRRDPTVRARISAGIAAGLITHEPGR